MLRTFQIFLLAMLTVAGLGSAKADETKIAALSLAPIPERTTIEIRLPAERETSELRLDIFLSDHFAELLAAKNYDVVDGDGELIFRFSIEEPTYSHLSDPRNTPVHASWRARDRSFLQPIAHSMDVQFVENPRDRFRLRVSVSRPTKPPLWSAVIERSVSGVELPAAHLKMADAVMVLWGQTFSQ